MEEELDNKMFLDISKRDSGESLMSVNPIGESSIVNRYGTIHFDDSLCSGSRFESEKNDNGKSTHLNIQNKNSQYKNIKNHEIIASGAGIVQDLYFCSCGNSEKYKKDSDASKEDTKKVSIRIGENLFLNLVTEIKDEIGKNGSEECVKISDSKSPSIQILVKRNGETIQDYSINEQEKKKRKNNIPEESKYLSRCHNSKKSGYYISSTKKEVPYYRECCMFSNGNSPIKSEKPKCSFIASKKCNDKLSTSKTEKLFRTEDRPQLEKVIQRNPSENRCTQLPLNFNCNIKRKEKSNTNISAKLLEKSTDQNIQSVCSCTPNKGRMPSLDSFSMLFITNNMRTEANKCEINSPSHELFKTALICVHIDKSEEIISVNSKQTVSYPEFAATDMPLNLSSSCVTEQAAFRSVLREPSMSAKGYSCFGTKEPTKRLIRPPSQKTKCTQLTRIKSPEYSEGNRNISTMFHDQQTSPIAQYLSKRKQASVQVCPCSRSVCIHPSRMSCLVSCTPRKPLQPNSTCTSKDSLVLGSICPTFRMNPPNPCSSGKPLHNIAKTSGFMTCPLRPVTYEVKMGSSVACTAVKSISCASSNIKYVPKSESPKQASKYVNGHGTTRCKSCTILSSASTMRDLSNVSSVCSTKLISKFKSNTSCNICQELSKFDTCLEEVKSTVSPCDGRPHSSAMNDFIYSESEEGNLQMFTEDYSDLTKALDTFLANRRNKNPKCKYIRKC